LKEALVQADKKTTVLVWASVGAAAAGIAVAAILFKCRNKLCADESHAEENHRHIEQVLRDCYSKIQEIEARIPTLICSDVPEVKSGASTGKPARPTASRRVRAANSKPVLDS
jgi:hypothetical protein